MQLIKFVVTADLPDGGGQIKKEILAANDAVIPAEEPESALVILIPLCGRRIYERNIGGKESILSDFFKLCFIQSMRTFAAVNDVPPFE